MLESSRYSLLSARSFKISKNAVRRFTLLREYAVAIFYYRENNIWFFASQTDERYTHHVHRKRITRQGDKPVRVLEVAFGNWQQNDIK